MRPSGVDRISFMGASFRTASAESTGLRSARPSGFRLERVRPLLQYTRKSRRTPRAGRAVVGTREIRDDLLRRRAEDLVLERQVPISEVS